MYDELLQHSGAYDFAIIITTPIDIEISRGKENPAPRDNVIFELGLFLGSLGRERVFALREASTPSKTMSDFVGVTYLTYDGDRSDRDLTKAVSPAATQIATQIKKVGQRRNQNADIQNRFSGELIGLEKIYDSFDLARANIYSDLKDTKGPIRIFIHIASQDVGIAVPSSMYSTRLRKKERLTCGSFMRRRIHPCSKTKG